MAETTVMTHTKPEPFVFDARLKESRDYWIKRLSGETECSSINLDYPRTGTYSPAKDTLEIKVDSETLAALTALTGNSQFLVYTTLLATLTVCLHRHTGSARISIGSPCLKEVADNEPQNLLTIINDVHHHLSFHQLLLNVRQGLLEAYARHEYPLDRLIDDLGVERAENKCPLFEVVMALKNIHADPPDVKQDLTITFLSAPNELTGVIEFNSSLFRRESIERFGNHFLNILQEALPARGKLIYQFNMLTARETELLAEWSDTKADYPTDICIHHLFEQQAQQTPEAIAVIHGQHQLTYGELNRRANQLALQLQAAGAGADTLVGICVDRSLEMAVGLLGILKSGGAYVPLDPSLPKARLRHIIDDAALSLLLTENRSITSIGETTARIIYLDGIPDEMAAARADVVDRVVSDNLAYVIYTSGSTGWPKGVLITHQGLVNYCLSAAKHYKLTPQDRVLQFASLSFDVCAEELFPTWISGAAVVMRNDDVPSPGDLLELLQVQQVSVLNLPSSYWREIVNELLISKKSLPDSLRLMVVGSEQLLAEAYSGWLKIGGSSIPFINAYGPTETTIAATLYEVSAELEALENRTHLPIGRPLANTQIHLLDKCLGPVPHGSTGELHIAGRGLARGYLNAPELTAERFLPNPFSREGGARVYKSGDLARYLSNGLIEFRGRVDHQVKVRGYRIELGEIEAVLSQHAAVNEAVVQGRVDELGNNRLVAYLIVARGEAPSINALKSHLREKLPDYMMPAAFELLESFPLTRSGKIDRGALPAPTWALAAGRGYVGSRTPNEAILAEIWSQVLGLERVGIHDNFFELGGDSIISIQIIARANQAGLHLTAKQLFQYQTIAGLATVASSTPLIVAEQGIVEGPLPLTPVQHWFFDQRLEDAHHWNNALMLDLRDAGAASLVRRAVGKLLLHHDALRLRFKEEAGKWEQHNLGAEDVAFTEVDLGELEPEERDRALTETAQQLQRSLNVSDGPIMRAAYFAMGAGARGQLLLIMHHLVIDAVSWRIVLEDLATVYEQLRAGTEITLPAKTSSFRSWAGRLHEYAQGAALADEFSYWQGVEKDANESRLPVDLEGGANTVGSEETLVVSLSATETKALLQEAPAAYRTQINDLLLTALVKAIARWSGSDSLLLDMEGHGREEIFEDIDISRTVGWFTSIYPVRLDTRGARTVGEAIKRVKEQLRGIPAKGIGYGMLRYLHNEADATNWGASAQVSFNYLGQFDQVTGAGADDGPYRLVNEPSGELQSKRGRRPYLLDVSGSIVGGQLHLAWAYSRAVHQRETIQRLAEEFLQQLRAIVSHCLEADAGGYTPSDFPLAQLDQIEIDRLLGADRNIEDVYPLTPMQEGMLFHTLYTPKSRAYFEQISFPVHQDLDIAAFETAWQRVMEKHSVLRTSFVWKGLVKPLQIVHKRLELPFQCHDWQELSEDQQQQRMKAHLQADLVQAFDLSVAPLLRIAVMRMAQNVYQVTISNHHMLLDAWSMPLIWEEVLAFYEAFSAGREVQAPKGIAFRNYVAWLQAQDMARAEAFWRQTLKGFTRATALPEKQLVGAPAEITEAMRRQDHVREIRLPEQTSSALQAMARQHRLTINTLAQGAWASLLSRYSSSEDVLFGGTVSGRSPTLGGVDSMVGLFINTLPVRVRIPPKSSAVEWLKQIQDDQIEARQYEYSPLEQIQKWSEVARGKPLFESIMIFHSMTHKAVQQNAGGPVKGVHIFQLATYPLGIVVASGQEMLFRIGYDPQRFDPVTITRMHEHFQALLEGMISNPRQRVSDLPLLRAAEQRELQAGRMAHERSREPGLCVHEAFEDQVRRSPSASAIAGEGRELTYGQLNARANKLAHYLTACQVGPEVRVGLLLEDPAETLVALLAVLKSGGAYVPFEPGDPKLELILADAHLSLLITRSDLSDPAGACSHFAEKVISLDADWQAIAGQSDENPRRAVIGEHLAYVMYVSGVNDAPKGVLVTHHSLTRYSAAVSKDYQIRPADRVLQSAPIARHQSVSEIFPCLTSGATLVQRATPVVESSRLFMRRCDDWSTTIVNLPSMYWEDVRTMLTTDALSIPDSIRLLITRRDGVLQDQLVTWRQETGKELRLVDTWATTEAMAAATLCDRAETMNGVRGLTPPADSSSNEVRTYLLDKYLQPVPEGIAGRLYIEGVGLARGYFNDPELTAATFIPNRFSHEPGSRLYDSGEWARYKFDGRIQCLDQVDDLPATSDENQDDSKPFLAPRDLLEFQLVGIWQEILNVEVIGITDNFFELGGSSLLALRLVSEIEVKLGASVPLVLFFNEPTIEHLAATLRLQAKEGASPLVPIQLKGSQRPFFCIHSIDGQVVWYFELARQLGPEQPFYGLRDLSVGGSVRPGTVEEMAAAYVEAIRTVQPEGPYRLGGWSSGGVIAFEMARQLHASDQVVELLVLFDSTCTQGVKDVDDKAVFKSIANAFVNAAAQKLSLSSDDFEDLDLDGKLALLEERARSANLLPADVGTSHYRTAIDMLSQNTLAIMRYAPEPYSGPVLLLRVTDNRPTDLGWQRVAAELEIKSVSGTHEMMVSAPYVEGLAKVLGAALNRR